MAEHGIDPDDLAGTGPGAGSPATTCSTTSTVVEPGWRRTRARPHGPAPRRPAAACAGRTGSRSGPAGARPGRHRRPAAAPPVVSGERDSSVPLSKIRKLTGSHMVMSKSVSPHAFSVVEVDYANVDATRVKVKGDWKATEGFSLTYLPFITRAVVDALAEFPHLNASVGEDELVVHNFVDIGIAVDLDYQGLLVPVVRRRETKRLRAIAREINDLADRARTRSSAPTRSPAARSPSPTTARPAACSRCRSSTSRRWPSSPPTRSSASRSWPTLPDGTEAIVIHPVGNLAMTLGPPWRSTAPTRPASSPASSTILETRDWAQEL